MVKKPYDNGRKDELIMSRRIAIDIYEGKNEMRGKIYGKTLKEG